MTMLLPLIASVFVSAQNPRYFEEDGKAWIPVGCNICFDPVREGMRPFHTETMRLRVYGLVGAKTTIVWCRDKECTWRTELEQGIPPVEIRDVVLPFESTSGFKVYLPWEDREVVLPAGKCRLPPFSRSCVIRFTDGSSAYLGIQRDI